MSIKEIVFEYIHINNGFITYDELKNCILSYNPGSAWNKTHWNYYRSNITSPNGRYFNQFSETERKNLNKAVEPIYEKLPLIENRTMDESKILSSNYHMAKKFTRPASLVKQGGLILYATSLKVSDLLIPPPVASMQPGEVRLSTCDLL
jgi:hypothetical protein